MDLLEGRYTLASNNLPAKQVAAVQIYENHQPIKLLDSLQFSDRAALNIKLKKNFSYAFPAKIAVGYKPVLWQTKLVPIIFTKKYQMITVLQANNTGQLLQDKILDFSNANAFVSQNSFDPYKWLMLSEVDTPPVDQDKYVDNTSFLSSFNYLVKLKNDDFLKLNFSYINDRNDVASMMQSNYFFA